MFYRRRKKSSTSRAAARESVDLADVATIMLLQGPRPDEVMSLQQTQVDLRNSHLTIWDNSAEGKSRKRTGNSR